MLALFLVYKYREQGVGSSTLAFRTAVFFHIFKAGEGKREASEECQTCASSVPRSLHSSEKCKKITPVLQANLHPPWPENSATISDPPRPIKACRTQAPCQEDDEEIIEKIHA